MEIALVIVGGLVLMTAIASGFTYLTERKKKGDAGPSPAWTRELERRLQAIETSLADREERLAQLENQVGFLNRLIEHKGRT